MMKKALSTLACLFVSCSLLAVEPPSPIGGDGEAFAGLMVEGYVSELQYNQRLLVVSGKQFLVPIETKVSNAQGGSNSFSLLRPEQPVRVLFELDKGERVAKEIWVLPPDRPPVEY